MGKGDAVETEEEDVMEYLITLLFVIAALWFFILFFIWAAKEEKKHPQLMENEDALNAYAAIARGDATYNYKDGLVWKKRKS